MAEVEGGYILLSRKLIESEIWNKPPLYLKVWIYILTKAQHKPYKNFDRGELMVSIPELIEVCSYKVGYRVEKPTKSQIFNILEWLRRTDEGDDERVANGTMIETTKTTRGMVVKVCNYNVYQDPKKYERNSEEDGEDVMKTTIPKRQPDTINKNDKNVKNEKKDNHSSSLESDFEKLWKLYPKKTMKKDALAAYKKAIKSGATNKDIQNGIVDYKKYLDANKDWLAVQGGGIWFKKERWNDDYSLETNNSELSTSSIEYFNGEGDFD